MGTRCLSSSSPPLPLLAADSSGPSSTVSSAGPSSPTTADTSPRFSFSEKISLTPQSSEETHASTNPASQAAAAAADLPLTPNNSPVDVVETVCCDDRLEVSHEAAEMTAGGDAPATPTDPGLRAPCSTLGELALSRMEGYCLPGSLPVLLELRESSSEAGSSSQTPQSPEGPDEFFDTQESLELWMDSPESTAQPEEEP